MWCSSNPTFWPKLTDAGAKPSPARPNHSGSGVLFAHSKAVSSCVGNLLVYKRYLRQDATVKQLSKLTRIRSSDISGFDDE
jgi:hypothetical protein